MPRQAVPAILVLVLLAGPVSSQIPVGPEFQINTYTSDSQRRHDASGNPLAPAAASDQVDPLLCTAAASA